MAFLRLRKVTLKIFKTYSYQSSRTLIDISTIIADTVPLKSYYVLQPFIILHPHKKAPKKIPGPKMSISVGCSDLILFSFLNIF